MPENFGKGLKDLLNEYDYSSTVTEQVMEIPLLEIKPNPYQPRYVFDEQKIYDLAQSISQHGLLQPIVVKKGKNCYNIVSGERRYRAYKLLGYDKIPAIIRMYEKEKVIQLALIENLQRDDLSPVEEAKAYMQIMRELDLTQKEVAQRVGKSRSYITNMLGLLNLPNSVLAKVDDGSISTGHAKILSKLEDKDKIKKLVDKVVSENLSVRALEILAKKEQKAKPTKTSKINPLEDRVNKDLETSIYNKYNIKTRVCVSKKEIKFVNDDDFKKFYSIVLGEDKDV